MPSLGSTSYLTKVLQKCDAVSTIIRHKVVSGACFFSVLPPENVTNIQTYRGAGVGFAVCVYGVCDIELLCGKDFFL